MFTASEIVWGIVFPPVIALLGVVLGHLPRRAERDAHPWGVTLALVAAFAAAFIGISGKLALPPRTAQEWLVLLSAGALVVSILSAIGTKSQRIAMGLSIGLLLATAWFSAAPRKRSLEPREFWTMLSIVGAGLLVWWAALEPLALRWRGAALPTLLSAVAGSAALVLVNGGTMRLGKIAGGIALALLAIAAIALWLRNLSLARGGILALTISVLGLLACGYLYADVKPRDAALVAVAGLAAWIGRFPLLPNRSRMRFVITAIAVIGVASLAVVPAVKGLLETMREQTESYRY